MKKMMVILLIFVSILICFIFNNHNSEEKLTITYQRNDNYVLVYYLYNDSIASVKKKPLTTDPIKDIYSYLTIYKNDVCVGYESYLSNDSTIKYYYTKDNIVYLYVSSFNDKMYTPILKSIKSLGYENVYIYI
ncbi:MAG: hypothetical protein ACI35W_06955 [Anaeroplasmataceae bacterium]